MNVVNCLLCKKQWSFPFNVHVVNIYRFVLVAQSNYLYVVGFVI